MQATITILIVLAALLIMILKVRKQIKSPTSCSCDKSSCAGCPLSLENDEDKK